MIDFERDFQPDEEDKPKEPGIIFRFLRASLFVFLNLIFGTARVLCYVGSHRYQRTNRVSLPERRCVRCDQHQIRVGVGVGLHDYMWITRRKEQ